MTKKAPAILIAGITILVYFLTVFSATKSVVNSLFGLYIVVASIGFMYYPFIRKATQNEKVLKIYFLSIFVSVLLWVGVTGWFFSPFFYLLYLLAIVLSFLYSPLITFVFVAVLLGIFIPNLGSIDLTLDIITMLSLFSVVPLTYFLQKEYLYLKQNEKKVLILESHKKESENVVDEALLNKITKFSVSLLEPANDIKQVALAAQKSQDEKKLHEELVKIEKLAEQALKDIEAFEEKVTGKKLVHTRKKN